MQYKDQFKKITAGIFLFFCIALIVVVVFAIGMEKGFTEPKIYMTVLFRDVGGLMLGSPVRLSGVTVGTVHSIDFLEKDVDGRGVKVVLSLYKKYEDQLRKSSLIAIETEGVLGEKIIAITARPSLYLKDLDRPIIGKDPLEVRDIAETFDSTAGALLNMSEEIGGMTIELKELTNSTRRLLNRIEQRVIDGSLFKVF